MNPRENPRVGKSPHDQPETEKPKFEKKEAFTSIARILGKKYEDISEEERRSIFESTEIFFKNQKILKKYLTDRFGENIPDKFKVIFFEREKSPEELEIIDLVNRYTNDLRNRFGLAELTVPFKNIYIVPSDAPWPEGLENSGGFYNPLGQFIAIHESKIAQLEKPNIIFAKKVFHDMVHFKSYNALKKLENSSAFGVYRTGLQISNRSDRNETYFGNLDEAIVEELTIRFLNELKDHPLFKAELEKTDRIREYLSGKETAKGESVLSGEEYYLDFDQNSSELHGASMTRRQERKILNTLIDKIYQNNINKFDTKNKIFDLFVKAVMTGNILPLGQLVDKVFGRGTFKKIALLENNIKQQEEFVDNL